MNRMQVESRVVEKTANDLIEKLPIKYEWKETIA